MNGTVIQGELVILIVILICSPYSKRLSRILALALRFRLYHDRGLDDKARNSFIKLKIEVVVEFLNNRLENIYFEGSWGGQDYAKVSVRPQKTAPNMECIGLRKSN